MSYRYLVLPGKNLLKPQSRKSTNWPQAGVPVIGPDIWTKAVPKMRRGEWLKCGAEADRLTPDLEFRNTTPGAKFDWIHRRDGQTDIYFVISDHGTSEVSASACFRVNGRMPELWDPVTGTIRELPEFSVTQDGRTEIPLRFALHQSWMVVFRERGQKTEARDQRAEIRGQKNFASVKPVMELSGAWEVAFDPQWFYPDNGTGGKVRFESLVDWTTRPEDAIKYFSGTATYRIAFDSQTQSPEFEIQNIPRFRFRPRHCPCETERPRSRCRLVRAVAD
jgi:hypothetical protein